MEKQINACFIVDDTPANGTYWARLQQTAFGYKASETGWATNWRSLAPAGLFRPDHARAFADFVEEFGIRGKFTFLPCPAGLGRVDRSIRGYTDEELKGLIGVVRDRVAKRMDITPEVLTHSMAFDPEAGALLPHTETAWVSYLCRTRQMEKLQAYIRAAYSILHNVGLTPHGLTTGGMEDFSGIGENQSVLHGFHRDALGEALLKVESEFVTDCKRSFVYTGSPPVSEASKQRRVPELVYESVDGGRVFEIHSIVEDPIFDVMHGPKDLVAKTTDALISHDLSRGLYVNEAEAGRTIVLTVHAQTLLAMNTMAGLQVIREACRRLRERYGKRLVWHTASELCDKIGT